MNLNCEIVKKFYLYNCTSNRDFLNNISKINNYTDIFDDVIKNNDMIESTDQMNELKNLYINNKLIAFRPGCIETSFLLKYKFNFDLNSHINFSNCDIDYHIKNNAGLYYKNINRKKEVLDWWCDNFIDLIKNCIYCSCYQILYCDIPLMAKLDLKGQFYNYSYLFRIILENSEGKKILYVGNAVDSIKIGYERDLKKLWKFPVSNFTMDYLKTPQTTIGMDYPHDTIIETCNELINEININYNDFDTAIFGCGCYGSSLINILRKIYPDKNLIYLGSDCFKMFGIKTKLWDWTQYELNVNKEHTFEVIEKLPEGCKNHPEKKYWKLEE
jgi:hypothetical protein